MADDAKARFAAQLERMRAEYGMWLATELHALVQAARALSSIRIDPTALTELRARLHKIAGGAATFSYARPSQVGRALELELDSVLARPAAIDAARLRRTLIDALGDLANAPPQADDAHVIVGTDKVKSRQPKRMRPRLYLLGRDAEATETLARSLAGFEYETQAFGNAGALIEACTDTPPDALVVELAYADPAYLDGMMVAETVTARLAARLPVLIDGKARGFSLELRAVRAGVEGFYSLPAELVALAEHLERLLRRGTLPALRVLMVDDDTATLEYHRLILDNAGFEVLTETIAERTLSVLHEFAPDVLVLDINMPGCSGPELARVVRYHTRWLQMPIVYLSAIDDVQRQNVAMMHSGDHFVVKPATPHALVATVSAQARRSRELAFALSRDALTGLLKHGDIKTRVRESLTMARRKGTPICAAMVDIDHFKHVNDTYGHLVGDEVIRTLAGLLKRRLRESDLIGRYGGEEFLLLLHDCDIDQAARVLEQVRIAFSGMSFEKHGATFHASFSAGITVPEGDDSVDALVARADKRLYAAKREGRNRVVAHAA